MAPQGFARRVGIKREPGLYCLFLKSGVGVRSLEIAAREGPISRAGRGSPSPTAAYGVACEAREAHRRNAGTIFQASYSGTAAAGSATPTYRYSWVRNGQVDSGSGRGLLAR